MSENSHIGAVIHHSTNPIDWDIVKTVSVINTAHKNRNFPRSSMGYYVGYHYVIDKYGVVKQTRLDTDVGAHTVTDDGANFKFLGICLNGNFQTDKLEGAQLKAVVALVRDLAKKYGWTESDIHYHGQLSSTACPGKDVIDQFKLIVEQAFTEEEPISDWAKEAVEWTTKNGIRTKVEDMQSAPTREEVDVLLHRYHKKFHC